MMNLGTFGIYTFDFEHQPATQVRDSAQELEERGWRALWVPEVGGREALTHAGFLLASTERLHVVNGIAQIWSREVRATYGASALLADAYPDRHVLGLGFGGLKRPGVKPLAAMADYLDELDALAKESPVPAPRTPAWRVLAAYGPKMLALARDRSLGAHTYHVNTAHTAAARRSSARTPSSASSTRSSSSRTPPGRARRHASIWGRTSTPRTTSPSSAGWATRTRRSSTAAATASWTTWCSGETWTRWPTSSGPMWRRGPIMSPSR